MLMDAFAALLSVDLSDPGYVMATGEYVKDNNMAGRALRRDSEAIKGITLAYAGLTESFGEENDEFFNTVEHRFKMLVVRSYADDDSGVSLINSRKEMMKEIWEIAAVLRANPTFGFGEDVQVKPIQMPIDLDEDNDELMGTFHFASIDVYIEQKVFAAGCDD